MLLARLLVAITIAHALTPVVCARIAFRRGPQSGAPIALRRRLNVNTLITEPGTVELEWNNSFSQSGAYSMPSTWKYTPQGHSILWGRTEYSTSFDMISSAIDQDQRTVDFGDRITLAATSVLFDGEKLDIAIVPQASYFLRGEVGARYGATAVARYDFGRNSGGATAGWSAATAPSSTNPSGTWDIGTGFGRRLAVSGLLGHLSLHANTLYERSTGVDPQFSFYEGTEIQFTERVALDISVQHVNVVGGNRDLQLVFGVTANLGRPSRWARR